MDSTQPISTTAKGPAGAAGGIIPPAATGGVTQATVVKKTAPKSESAMQRQFSGEPAGCNPLSLSPPYW